MKKYIPHCITLLGSYLSATPPAQTDKNKNSIILYTSDKASQDVYIENAKKKNYDVIILDGVIDSHFINHLEQKLEKIQLKRIDSDVVDKLIDKDEKKESVITEKESKNIKELFEKIIDDKNANVTVEALNVDDFPVIVTHPEFMRRMKDMAKSSGSNPFMMGGAPEMISVSINGNHKLIQKIIQAKTNKTKEKIASQAYDLSLLSQNMLSGSKMTDFIKRSIDIISK